jgi:23S rRNA (uracil1939-C5)-methyltransferase
MINITKLDNKGRGISYYNDTIMFVKNALPEETVEVSDIIDKKKYYEATSTKIEKKSINRITPKCPYYDVCGGCNIAHMTYEYQCTFKINKVKEILNKYASIDTNIKFIPSNKDFFYRNKITLKKINNEIGFYDETSHNLCKINKCLIANDTFNSLIKDMNFITFQDGEVTLRVNYENKIIISIYTRDTVKIDFNNIPDNIEGIVVNNKTLYKNNYFYDYIDDLKFKVSYNSFFQINNYIAGYIFNILRNNLKGKNLLDLYCGVGTLGLSLKDQYKNIYGIEKIENAILDAKINARNNGITNAHYYVGDTSKILKKINMKFDTVIVDPPRSGLNKETLKQVIEINARNLCYISCDPMTLARDLKELNNIYQVNKIYVLDMFPNTYHVESVCILERK